jgi:hypothetical protein
LELDRYCEDRRTRQARQRPPPESTRTYQNSPESAQATQNKADPNRPFTWLPMALLLRLHQAQNPTLTTRKQQNPQAPTSILQNPPGPHQNHPEFIRIHRHPPEPTRIHQGPPEPTRTTRTHKRPPQPTRIHRSQPGPTRIHQSSPEPMYFSYKLFSCDEMRPFS